MSDLKEKWYIGIDFGTSNTLIVAYEATEGVVYTNNSFQKTNKTNQNIPTVITQEVFLEDTLDNLSGIGYHVGLEALMHNSLTMFRDLKDAARTHNPSANKGKVYQLCKMEENDKEKVDIDCNLKFNNNDFDDAISMRDLLAQFFKNVLRIDKGETSFSNVRNINKDTLEKIVIGCPVKSKKIGMQQSYEYAKTLKEILADSFARANEDDRKKIKKKIKVVEEPELAGITYFYSNEDNKTTESKTVLVIDIGGGTSDFSLLKCENGKRKAINIGSCNYAGNSIDQIIYELLPKGLKKSKVSCRIWKETLFANEKIPIPTKDIKAVEIGKLSANESLWICYENKRNISNSIVLSEGKLFIGGKEERAINTNIVKIFEAITTALKKSLDDNQTKFEKIDTVFFIGGTSIIAPMRDMLINGIKDYCVVDFDESKNVVTAFGDNVRTIKIDASTTHDVTHYNAVAIGAFIKAFGEDKLCFRPKIKYKSFWGNEGDLNSTDDKNLLIKTKNGVPFAYGYIGSEYVQRAKSSYNSFYEEDYFENKKMSFWIEGNDSEKKYYIITKDELFKTGEKQGLLVYALIKKEGIEYRACCCNDSDIKFITKDFAEFLTTATDIEMELIN